MNVLCHRVPWGQGDDAGKAFDGGELQLLPSLADGDEFHVKTKKKGESIMCVAGWFLMQRERAAASLQWRCGVFWLEFVELCIAPKRCCC